MKESIIQAWDDLEYKMHGVRVPADTTVLVGLDGTWYELDLKEEHYSQLMNELAKYLDSGTRLDVIPEKKRKRSRYNREADGYYADMRAYSDKQNNPELKYHVSGNGYYYPKKLQEAYKAHTSVTERSYESAKAG